MKKGILLSFLAYNLTASFHAQTIVTIQPDALQGKDATIWYLTDQSGTFGTTNSLNYGNDPHFHAMQWTWNGDLGTRQCLIDFDLSVIPPNSAITNASLSLYAFPGSPDGGHNPLSGSNSCFLSKITSPWNELTVTWDNQPTIDPLAHIILPASTSPTDDYLNLNVTTLMQDKYTNPSGNHGLMLSMINNTHYRSLIFASSDHTDPNKRPKLVITYTSTNSLESLDQVNDFKIYPNPSDGVFTISTKSEFTYRMVSTSGQEILNDKVVYSGNQVLDLSKMESGVYFVEVESYGVKSTRKIIIN